MRFEVVRFPNGRYGVKDNSQINPVTGNASTVAAGMSEEQAKAEAARRYEQWGRYDRATITPVH